MGNELTLIFAALINVKARYSPQRGGLLCITLTFMLKTELGQKS